MPRRRTEPENKNEKMCVRCGITKALDDFPKEAARGDGRKSACRQCENKRVSDYHKADRPKENRRVQAWRRKNRDHVREVEREWYKNNKEASATKAKRYRANNPSKVTETNKRSHAKHYVKNKAAIIQRVSEYKKENPQVASATQRKRRALKNGSPVNDFTNKQWKEMQAAFGHRCAYCLRRFKGRLTQEHITPISKGGAHTLSNIVPACQSCNSKKHVGPPLCPIQPLLLL